MSRAGCHRDWSGTEQSSPAWHLSFTPKPPPPREKRNKSAHTHANGTYCRRGKQTSSRWIAQCQPALCGVDGAAPSQYQHSSISTVEELQLRSRPGGDSAAPRTRSDNSKVLEGEWKVAGQLWEALPLSFRSWFPIYMKAQCIFQVLQTCNTAFVFCLFLYNLQMF